MKDFFTWMKENIGVDEDGLRTGLGLYPPAYAVSQYPSLFFAPISAGAANSLTHIHKKDAHFESGAEKKKHKHKKHKKK